MKNLNKTELLKIKSFLQHQLVKDRNNHAKKMKI